jgi:hypothetical protein
MDERVDLDVKRFLTSAWNRRKPITKCVDAVLGRKDDEDNWNYDV